MICKNLDYPNRYVLVDLTLDCFFHAVKYVLLLTLNKTIDHINIVRAEQRKLIDNVHLHIDKQSYFKNDILRIWDAPFTIEAAMRRRQTILQECGATKQSCLCTVYSKQGCTYDDKIRACLTLFKSQHQRHIIKKFDIFVMITRNRSSSCTSKIFKSMILGFSLLLPIFFQVLFPWCVITN